MPDYNDPNMDKRLKQDKVEREKKATSKGLWAAIVLILIVIIVGFYLYTPRSVETTSSYQETTGVPVTNTDNTMPPAPPSTDTTAIPSTTPDTTPAPTDNNAVPPDVVAPSDNNAQ